MSIGKAINAFYVCSVHADHDLTIAYCTTREEGESRARIAIACGCVASTVHDATTHAVVYSLADDSARDSARDTDDDERCSACGELARVVDGLTVCACEQSAGE